MHQADGVVATQLLHSGSMLQPPMVPEKAGPYGPSATDLDPVCGAPVRALTRAQIAGIVDDYGKAAARTRAAGFDAVQIHAAHGYLINQFLSPARNRRKDAYGGPLARRARRLCEVYEAVRGKVGAGFPVLVEMSAYDGFSGGVEPADAVVVAAELDRLGIDAVEVSAGTPAGAERGGWDHIMPGPLPEGGFFGYALQVAAAVTCPVVNVEGWRDPPEDRSRLGGHRRGVTLPPVHPRAHLAARWRSGDPSPATCISCNQCLHLILEDGLACIFHDRDEDRAPAGA